MELKLDRFLSNFGTIGKLYIDDKFSCYTLEPKERDVKIAGKTAIRPSTYDVGVNVDGLMNAEYKARFSELHKGMLEIKNVPDFLNVYIHIGNFLKDTLGCILVGDSYTISKNEPTISNSVITYKKLYSTLIDEAIKNKLTISITNSLVQNV